MLEYVIIPYVEKHHVSLNLDFDHPPLLIMDVFKGQMTCAVRVIKVGLSPSKKNCVISLIESPLKVMKNGFYFILKALFVLKIRKIRLTSKFMTSQPGSQTIAIHILPVSHEVKATRPRNLVN